MRIVILWTHESDYLRKFMRRLSASGNQIIFLHLGISADAPYAELASTYDDIEYVEARSLNFLQIMKILKTNKPEIVLLSSWNVIKFVTALKLLRPPLVLCMDNQWRGTLKQIIGVVLWRLGFYPKVQAFLVPGARQEKFARKLTWKKKPILTGLYSSVFDGRSEQSPKSNKDRSFVFVGRLIPLKGIRQLIDGYRKYRDQVENPWSLKLVGAGPSHIDPSKDKGVAELGFLQMNYLERELSNSSALVLVSEFEPWGVALHDAVCLGLPLIATRACGSTDKFLINSENGFLLETNDPNLIANAMIKMHRLTEDEYFQFSKKSLELASLISYDSTVKQLLNTFNKSNIIR